MSNAASLIQFLKELGPLKLAGIGIALLTVLIVGGVYLRYASNQNMSVLYSDLDPQDSGKIVEELESKKIPYELGGDGSIIKIPADMILRTRMSMAQAGLPSNGGVVGYEIFNNEESLGTTNFLQNVKMVRALEGELSRTISSFDQIERARVHLVIPQRAIFSKEKEEPKASVVLKFKAHQTLNKSEIDGIAYLVATAVPGLEVQNITIVDTHGRSLKLGEQEEGGMFGTSNSDDYRVAYEQRLKKDVERLLEKSLGPNKVTVQVSVEMNFDRIVTNSEIYDPEGAVVRSVQSISDKEKTPVGSGETDTSVANNIPGGNPNESENDKNMATIDRSDETTNYEISKTVKNQISETGTVKKMSIAVLVDGTYTRNAETKKLEYIPRGADELKKIEDLVKVAAGFREDRQDKIEVVNMQFITDTEETIEAAPDWFKDELPSLIQTLVIAIVVVLIFVTVVRPISLRIFDIRKAEQMASVQQTAADQPLEEIDIQSANKAVSIRKVAEIIESHPQEAIMVLRKWMNEDV